MLAVAFGFLNYKIKRKTFDFYMMFLVGIAWVVLGFLFKMWFLIVIGFLFFIIGVLKRREWGDDLSTLGRAQREEILSIKTQTNSLEKLFIWLVIIGIVILGLVIFYIIKANQ